MDEDLKKALLSFKPEEFGYRECPHCNGWGNSLKEQAPVCTMCGGSGLIKIKEDDKCSS